MKAWSALRGIVFRGCSASLRTTVRTFESDVRKHRVSQNVTVFSSKRFSFICAASKVKEVWQCNKCGEQQQQWHGKCPECSKFNSLSKVQVYEESSNGKVGGGGGAAAANAVFPAWQTNHEWEGGVASPDDMRKRSIPVKGRGGWVSGTVNRPQSLSEVKQAKHGAHWRLPLPGPAGKELSRVFGGGVVPGSLTLIGGDPGIGKSTLLLQLASILSQSPVDPASPPSHIAHVQDVLYVSAEESVEQVGSRAERMGLVDAEGSVFLYSATVLDLILDQIVAMQPCAVIIDSIQTVYLDKVSGSAGSITQVRECTTALLHVAKRERLPIFLVGHVTKQGDIAGPRVLEHIVDTVLYMEGERHQAYRLLRGIKNRYGATDEVGVFTMDESGLNPVPNPSALFLSDRSDPLGVSSAVSVTMEGTRPLLVEIQALCSPNYPQGQNMGPPLRAPNGIPRNRLFQVLAILSKYAKLKTYANDIHTNVVGGLTVTEPATDLAVAISIASSICEVPVPQNMAFIGELGLGGELRPVTNLDRRVKEAAKLGFDTCLVPGSSSNTVAVSPDRLQGMKLIYCKNISSALEKTLGRFSA